MPTDTHCPYCSLQCGITLAVGVGPVALRQPALRVYPAEVDDRGDVLVAP